MFASKCLYCKTQFKLPPLMDCPNCGRKFALSNTKTKSDYSGIEMLILRELSTTCHKVCKDIDARLQSLEQSSTYQAPTPRINGLGLLSSLIGVSARDITREFSHLKAMQRTAQATKPFGMEESAKHDNMSTVDKTEKGHIRRLAQTADALFFEERARTCPYPVPGNCSTCAEKDICKAFVSARCVEYETCQRKDDLGCPCIKFSTKTRQLCPVDDDPACDDCNKNKMQECLGISNFGQSKTPPVDNNKKYKGRCDVPEACETCQKLVIAGCTCVDNKYHCAICPASSVCPQTPK